MVAAVALMALVSCNKEVTPSEEIAPVGETVTFTAYADGADVTKAQLNDDQQSEWVSGDAITIHNGTSGYEFVTTEAGAKADFSYTGNDFSGEKFIAVYPAGEYTVDVAAKTVNVNIPKWQEAKAGTYHKDAAIAVAYSENMSLSFKNTTALLKFSVNMDNVTHVYFEGNNSEVLVGDIKVNLVKDEASVDGLKVSAICLENTDDAKVAECYAYNGFFTKGETYYMAVAPQTFENGVVLKIKRKLEDETTEEIVVRSTSGKVVTKASSILNLGEIGGMSYTTQELVEKIYLKPGVWGDANAWFAAHFYNPIGGTVDIRMTLNEDGLYEVAVPKGADKVIFCRMNPSAEEFSWEGVWDQSDNLNIPVISDDNTCYAVSDWHAGDWKTYEDATAVAIWGICGSFNGWNNSDENYHMTLGANNWYEKTGVRLLASDEFKFVTENSWTGSLGASGSGAYTATDKTEHDNLVIDGKNIKVSKDGVYTISLNPVDKKFKVVRTGDIPAQASGNWCLVGSFQGWNAADNTYKMVTDDIWFIYKNFKLDSDAEVKVLENNSWNNNRGGNWTGVDNVISVSANGANIKVPKGTYDVYMNAQKTKIYFMTSGRVPTN